MKSGGAVTVDDDKSRSGRTINSVSSKSSDTPSRNNLTSLKLDFKKIPFAVTPGKDSLAPVGNLSSLDNLNIPAHLVPKFDDKGRITRQKMKRLNEASSSSSNESHQRQVKKSQRK